MSARGCMSPLGEEAYEKAELLNQLGKKAKAAGLGYGYHNHNNDFDRYGDETVIDIFLNNTDPELVTFELDAAWGLAGRRERGGVCHRSRGPV